MCGVHSQPARHRGCRRHGAATQSRCDDRRLRSPYPARLAGLASMRDATRWIVSSTVESDDAAMNQKRTARRVGERVGASPALAAWAKSVDGSTLACSMVQACGGRRSSAIPIRRSRKQRSVCLRSDVARCTRCTRMCAVATDLRVRPRWTKNRGARPMDEQGQGDGSCVASSARSRNGTSFRF